MTFLFPSHICASSFVPEGPYGHSEIRGTQASASVDIFCSKNAQQRAGGDKGLTMATASTSHDAYLQTTR